ncbi:thiamine pyrophosphate-binding protein [Streptomyces huiliensis]|uniref:thiamine pyrophosphate-binding protein n=1 Tax=Streptomyces huiliensis TaxID=2876027 RepID=UPI001CBFA94D|nr:thiamine pyrophosphate-dependent enzyme [Streptomyces huiliensis]MBZ4322462.1 thiamine pyrophosphate-binding protein [Streptomyces huiliensis]
MGSSPRVVDFVTDFLRLQGVRHVFGVGGANIEDLYDALHLAQDGPLGVVAKHEFSAAAMADGYHRASQRVPVIVSTSGAGAMNLVPGIAELRASCVPAVVLVGQPSAALDGRGSFQETSGLAGSIDAVRLFGELAVSCVRVDEPEAITDALPRAFAAATDPASPGPAVLLLPKDVQQAVLPAWAPPRPVAPAAPPLSAPAVRARAAGLLRDAARRPGGVVVIAGEGVARADARPRLAALVRRLSAGAAGVTGAASFAEAAGVTGAVGAAGGVGVAVVPDAKDVFAPRDPHHLGIAGPIGPAAVQEALERASAVLLAGTRLPQMADGGPRDRLKAVPVVSLDPREPFLDAHGELIRLTGPLAAELDLLSAALGPADDDARPAPVVRPTPPAPPPPPDAPLDMRTAALLVSAALPEGTTVVADAGNTGAVALHHIDVPPGGRFVAALGMGGMGHGFGAGIGAAFATGRRTCVVAGDGAFFMHGMEVHTAVEHRLPVTFVVFNNNAHGMCATRERLFFSGDYSYNLFRPARIGDGAAALFPGLAAVTVRTAGELTAALGRAHATPAPALICVDVDPTEMPPFRPFLQHALRAGAGRPAREGAVPG